MKPTETVSQLLANIENSEFKKVNELLTEDFSFKGPTPEALDKDEFIKMHKSILKGIPNFNYNVTNLKEENGKVKGTVQITGKHTGTLDLDMINLPAVKATNKDISLPSENFEIVLTGGKIKSLVSKTPENGGVTGLLKQIGVKAPQEVTAKN